MRIYAAFGLALGVFLSFVGLTILNTHFGFEAAVTNPLRQTPLIGPVLGWTGLLGPEMFEGGIEFANLAQIIFTGLITMIGLGLFIATLIIFVTRPHIVKGYAVFGGMLIAAFLIAYVIGQAVMGGVLGVF